MVAKLRSDCKIASPVDGSAAWPTSEEPATMATPKAAQNGTFQRVSRRSMEDLIGGLHDSTYSMAVGVLPIRPRRRLTRGRKVWPVQCPHRPRPPPQLRRPPAKTTPAPPA